MDAAASTSALRLVDAMPDFWEFWANARDLPDERRFEAFRADVIARHPELYTSEVLLGDGSPVEPEIEKRLRLFFRESAGWIDLMRQLSDRVSTDLSAHVPAFLATFPTFSYDGAVYLMVSLRSFDGALRTIDGKRCLAFGIDEIARVHGQEADLTVLFDHELFHVHHLAVFPGGFAEPHPLWRMLWVEGLATHVSERLNPRASMTRVLGLPRDLEQRARPMTAALAREIRSKLDSTERGVYADFFYGQGPRTDIPSRSGYYVGLLIARSLCAGADLADAARWGGASLRDRIERELTSLTS